MMAIRHAKKSDFKPVKEMLQREGMIPPRKFTKKRFENAITLNNRYSFVEERNGKIIGFITGFDDGGAFFGYIGRLVVNPKYRRLGIAKNLIQHCISELRKNNIQIVFVGIHKDNLASETLFKKFGIRDGGYRLMYLKP